LPAMLAPPGARVEEKRTAADPVESSRREGAFGGERVYDPRIPPDSKAR
jgi:hypothetical protein